MIPFNRVHLHSFTFVCIHSYSFAFASIQLILLYKFNTFEWDQIPSNRNPLTHAWPEETRILTDEKKEHASQLAEGDRANLPVRVILDADKKGN